MNIHEVFFESAGDDVTPISLAQDLDISLVHWLEMEQLDKGSPVGMACMRLMRVALKYERLMTDVNHEHPVVDWTDVYRQMQVYLFG